MPHHKILMSLALLMLTACAESDAFRRGQEQLLSREWEKAINSLNQASRDSPENPKFSSAAARASEQAVNSLLDEAGAVRESKPNEAAAMYLRALRLSPSNERAAKGLEYIETSRKQQRLLDDAERALNNGREQEAREKYKKLLDEVPSNRRARQALLDMDERAGRNSGQPILAPALRKSVTLEFRESALKMVFDAIARSTGISFIFDRDLKQDTKISLFLKDVAFDVALDQILSSNGLAKRVVNETTLLIYSAQPAKIKEYQNLTVRNFFIANADVKQISNLLKTILKVKDIYVDEKRNLIVVRDTPEIVLMAEKMIAAHDQPEPEVMLEVEILEFNITRDESLGVKFPDQVAFGVLSPIALDALQGISTSGISITGLNAALAINLRRQLGDVNMLANPRIRVRNREKAKLHIGDKVPVITSTTYPGATTAITSSAVSYLDVGIKLEFEPIIQLDDDVIIKTVLEVSSITNTVANGGTTAYQVGTRNATTTLTLRDGETQVLAGLLSTDETNTTDRLPGLGDIPGLGALFSKRSAKGGRKEILLSITPRVVRNLQRPTKDLIELNFGPETGGQGTSAQGNAPTVAASSIAPSPAPAAVSPERSQTLKLTPMTPFGANANVTTFPASAPVPPATSAPASGAPTLAPTGTPPAADPGGSIEFELPPGVGGTR